MRLLLIFIHQYIRFANLINRVIGKTIPWLCLLMVLLTFAIVVFRYAFNYGNIAMQESVLYMHASVFMLAAAYTLNRNQHVRVDIFYHRLTESAKAWINLGGTLFLLLPVCGFILWSSSEYVFESWKLQEKSREAGGLPFVYLLKSNMIALAILLIIQGISDLLQNLFIIFKRKPLPVDSINNV